MLEVRGGRDRRLEVKKIRRSEGRRNRERKYGVKA